MRPRTAIRAIALVAVLLPAPSFAGEKQQGTLVNPGPVTYDRDACDGGYTPSTPSASFIPNVSKAKFKFDDKCKAKIGLKKMSGLPLGDGLPGTGDELICLINFIDSGAGSCGGFILRGEAAGSPTSEKVTIQFAGATDLPGTCPPPAGDRVHVTTVEGPSQGLCVLATTYVTNPPTPAIAVQGVLF
jgi:hypothetical protein